MPVTVFPSVLSVNGKTGTVALTAADVGADVAGSAAAVAARVDALADIGAQVYVNGTTGDDTDGDRGTSEFPFKTLEAALLVAATNDEIKVFGPVTASVGTNGYAIGARIQIETGAILTVATGVTLFENVSAAPRIYGNGQIILQGSARLITGSAIFPSIELNSITYGNGSLIDTYAIDLGANSILRYHIASTMAQSAGAIGGAIRCVSSVVDIRIGGQITNAATRNTPLIKLTICKGRVDCGWNQNTASSVGVNAAPLFHLGVAGIVIFNGGILQGASTFLRLDNMGAGEAHLQMYGMSSQGTGTIIDHLDGDWAADVGLYGPSGAGNAAIVTNGVAGSGLGVSGYVTAGTSADAIKINSTLDEVEISAKVYGDIDIITGASMQARDCEVKGTIKGAGTVHGVNSWSVSTYPTATVVGSIPNVDTGMI